MWTPRSLTIVDLMTADMAQVEGLVGVGRGELDHDALASGGKLSEILVRGDLGERFVPIDGGEGQIQESLHGVIGSDLGDIVHEPLTDGIARSVGGAVGDFQERESDEGIVTLELFTGNGDLESLRRDRSPVQGLDRFGSLALDEFFRCHHLFLTEIALEEFAAGRTLETADRLLLDLAHTLTGKAEALADLFESHLLAADAEERLDDFAFTVGQGGGSRCRRTT